MISADSPDEAAPSTEESQFDAARKVISNCSDIYNLKLSDIDKIGTINFQSLMAHIASSISVKQKRPWATNGRKNENYKGDTMSVT